MKKRRCYIYTRVSTSMQVEGYSLEAQKERLRKYADFQEMVIVGEYSDEGKSGKSIEGRQEFMQMLRDIEEGKDRVEFVLVYKLSRFGRNAADVLNSLQRMQDFGVNLICVEDGIDSSKDSGKLMISVLSAVAEIERENILVQTMEGRRQKARDGKWNGGFAPYGYKLLNGELEIAEDEAEIIRIIFDKYIHTNMGVNGIAAYLNEHGYKKKKRQNNTLDAFATSFIKGVLDNPIYCGKLAFGRRKTERVPGKRNEFRIVKQDSYILSDGIHEAIISEDDWNLAKQKRNINGVKHEKIHSLEHEHILSGILKCPICGKGMYGNVNRKKKKDGTFYKDYFYYACKHRYYVNGHKCDYRKQWNEEKVNDAVAEVIKKLVNNPKFEAAIRAKINSKIDTGELETEHENLKKQLRQVLGAKNRLGQQMDNLDISDKMYDRKYQDMQDRLNGLYDEIERLESLIDDIVSRKEYIRQQKISEDGVYQYLLYFDKLYDKFTDMEKKEFMNSFVERVDIYEDEQPNGRFLKHIKFKFPVFFDGEEIQELSWDNETTVETFPQSDDISGGLPQGIGFGEREIYILAKEYFFAKAVLLKERMMKEIEQFATQFRRAIDLALEAGEFDNDSIYRRFPRACCGDTSDLLAQYLLDKGIKTDYVCGTYWGKPDGNGQSHAWLMVDKYIIIDITGDQFSGKSTFLNYDKSVYVGEGDDFHRLFEVEDRDVHEHRGLSALGGFCGPRLWDLYRKILKYI